MQFILMYYSCFFLSLLLSFKHTIYNLVSFYTLILELDTSTTPFCNSHWFLSVWYGPLIELIPPSFCLFVYFFVVFMGFFLLLLFFAEWTRQRRGKVLSHLPTHNPNSFFVLAMMHVECLLHSNFYSHLNVSKYSSTWIILSVLRFD